MTQDRTSTEPKRQTALGDLARFSGLGLQYAATVGVFALLGRWLDQRLGASPACLLVGVFLGFGLGLYSIVKKLPSSSRSSPRAKDGPKPPA
jgi:F0F1-type ATP synthase assembly protein I